MGLALFERALKGPGLDLVEENVARPTGTPHGRGGADDIGDLLRGCRNPNGILSPSPGLRQRRYPGEIPKPQPRRGCVIPTQTVRPIPCRVCGETPGIRPERMITIAALWLPSPDATPLGLMTWIMVPQGSGRAATLG